MKDKVFVIAEAGVNHNGNIDLAKELILKASMAGADAIKFQSFCADKLVLNNAKKANYQIENSNDKEETQYDLLKKLELGKKDIFELNNYAKEKNIMFISSPFDLDSIDILKQINMPIYKIPSGEINNVPYLRKIGKLRKKIFLSSGMCNLEEISFALNILRNEGSKDIVVLHCNTEYPTHFEDVNLKAMLQIRDKFNVDIGYSDHTLGIEVPIAAAALGAKVIEKHFTLDRDMDGPDHKASLEFEELKNMILAIRNIETCLGDGVKKVSDSERKNMNLVRKSIVAKRDIKRNEIFSDDNIAAKRPASGISVAFWDDVIGCIAKRDFKKDEMIEL
ncbi:MAG: N-acetylneuraminate synthase [Clostridium sp.]|nr:N-acetylneuraminate synthase [Clostridium sp.]